MVRFELNAKRLNAPTWDWRIVGGARRTAAFDVVECLLGSLGVIDENRVAGRRRAKTDRLDGDKLLAMLLRHRAGERVWSVLHEPTAEDEDARRTHRELARLMHERTAHTNRIGSLLVLHNLRPRLIIGGRDWARWWERHGEQVPPVLRAEIERECARLALVKQQVKALEAARRQELAAGKQPLVVGSSYFRCNLVRFGAKRLIPISTYDGRPDLKNMNITSR